MKTNKRAFYRYAYKPPFVVLTDDFDSLPEAVAYAESLGLWVYCFNSGTYIDPSLYHRGYYEN